VGKLEQAVTRLLIGGPGLWASVQFFQHFKKSAGFPLGIKSFSLVCRAAGIRFMLNTFPEGGGYVREVNSGKDEDESLLIYPFKDWLQLAAPTIIEQHARDFDNRDFERNTNENGLIKGNRRGKVQGVVYTYLLDRCSPFNPVDYYTYKLSLLMGSDVGAGLAARTTHAIDTLKKLAPPCVLFNLVSAWCNGWATAARFQQKARCCLHTDCHGEDSLLHYLVCQYHRPTLASYAKVNAQCFNAADFLCLNCTDADTLAILAGHLYAVKRAADVGRYSGPCSSEQQLMKLLWGFHKVAAIQSSAMRRIYRHIWS
jgi:hypothetical protein